MGFQKNLQAVDTPSDAPICVNTGGVSHTPGDTIHQTMKHLERHGDPLGNLLQRKSHGDPAHCCSHGSGKSSDTPRSVRVVSAACQAFHGTGSAIPVRRARGVHVATP